MCFEVPFLLLALLEIWELSLSPTICNLSKRKLFKSTASVKGFVPRNVNSTSSKSLWAQVASHWQGHLSQLCGLPHLLHSFFLGSKGRRTHTHNLYSHEIEHIYSVLPENNAFDVIVVLRNRLWNAVERKWFCLDECGTAHCYPEGC